MDVLGRFLLLPPVAPPGLPVTATPPGIHLWFGV